MKRESKKAKRVGRPALPKGEALDGIVPATRCKLSERAAFDRAAKKEGLTLSEWIRQTLKQAVEK